MALQYLWEIPSTNPLAVEILKLPVARVAILPMWIPVFLPFVTPALTISPVWKPKCIFSLEQ